MPSGSAAALLIGINYVSVPNAKLNGCINDINMVAKFLQEHGGFLPSEITLLDDVKNYQEVTYTGIIRNLYNLAIRSWKEKLQYVWIHYSGHGSNMKDTNNDELDGLDEALVPVDFMRNGIIPDDVLNRLLGLFNPATRITVIIDACHSGTMADLKYKYIVPEKTCTVENKNPAAWQNNAKVCMISGCRDNQTSADASFIDASGVLRPAGALTHCLLKALNANPTMLLQNNILDIASQARALLEVGRFSQVPEVCSTFDLLKIENQSEACLIPASVWKRKELQNKPLISGSPQTQQQVSSMSPKEMEEGVKDMSQHTSGILRPVTVARRFRRSRF